MDNKKAIQAAWRMIYAETSKASLTEPLLNSFFNWTVLQCHSLENSLARLLSMKLVCKLTDQASLEAVFQATLSRQPDIVSATVADLEAVVDRDPASFNISTPYLYQKGFHALQIHRLAHHYWRHGKKDLSLFLQSQSSQAFAVDIHPAARIGKGIFIDHGTGVVIGETALVEDQVSILQDVTLGGTGKETGIRHPKIRKGALICAGAKVLGHIEIGEGAKLGAGSVVLEDVPPHATAVGVPAKVVYKPARVKRESVLEMKAKLA